HDGDERAFTWTGDPGTVRLDPGWHHAAFSFLRLGFLHILGGLDHLLFLLCLVIPLRDLRALVVVVTSFTVAHSITLAAAALGLAPAALWFPPLIEVLIAASIVYMAFENIVGARLERRWVMAFGFGLVHGFGFSFMLSESLQFAGAHLAISLLAFNVGVELGQVLVLLLVLPALAVLFRTMRERIGVILLSALVAHSAWHWMTERAGSLAQYDVALPAFDAAFALAAMRFAMLALLTALAALAMHALARRFAVPSLPAAANPGSAD
ncbi:MAG TPA: HupE/UreJ family protein, partial [Longimicrobiales bacterium]|nr:HupE/UreJ family protein [Longimicrobiales bacterium]